MASLVCRSTHLGLQESGSSIQTPGTADDSIRVVVGPGGLASRGVRTLGCPRGLVCMVAGVGLTDPDQDDAALHVMGAC